MMMTNPEIPRHAWWGRWLAAVALAVCLAGPLAAAQEAESADELAWSSLSDEQQEVLSRLESRWDSLDRQRRQALADGAKSACETALRDLVGVAARTQGPHSPALPPVARPLAPGACTDPPQLPALQPPARVAQGRTARAFSPDDAGAEARAPAPSATAPHRPAGVGSKATHAPPADVVIMVSTGAA